MSILNLENQFCKIDINCDSMEVRNGIDDPLSSTSFTSIYSNVPQNIDIGLTYEKVVVPSLAVPGTGGQLENDGEGGIIYKSGNTHWFRVNYSFNIQQVTSNDNTEWGISLNGGAPIESSNSALQLSTVWASFNCSFLVELSSGDTLELVSRSSPGSTTIDFDNYSLTVSAV